MQTSRLSTPARHLSSVWTRRPGPNVISGHCDAPSLDFEAGLGT